MYITTATTQSKKKHDRLRFSVFFPEKLGQCFLFVLFVFASLGGRGGLATSLAPDRRTGPTRDFAAPRASRQAETALESARRRSCPRGTGPNSRYQVELGYWIVSGSGPRPVLDVVSGPVSFSYIDAALAGEAR
jgi:hypothetical protein